MIRYSLSVWNEPSPLRERLVAELGALGLVCADKMCFCQHCSRTECIFCYTDFTDPRDGPVDFGADCDMEYMPPAALESVAACLAFNRALATQKKNCPGPSPEPTWPPAPAPPISDPLPFSEKPKARTPEPLASDDVPL